jgi:hypothetical protein
VLTVVATRGRVVPTLLRNHCEALLAAAERDDAGSRLRAPASFIARW